MEINKFYDKYNLQVVQIKNTSDIANKILFPQFDKLLIWVYLNERQQTQNDNISKSAILFNELAKLDIIYLSLDIRSFNILNFQNMVPLISALTAFSQLKHLKIRLEMETLDLRHLAPQEIQGLYEQGKSIPYLESLEIEKQVADDNQIYFIFQLFSKQKQLKHLGIELENSIIGVQGMDSIQEFIEEQKNLKQFTFTVANNPITIKNNFFLTFLEKVFRQPELEDFTISIIHCKFQFIEFGMNELQIQDIHSLRKFQLKLNHLCQEDQTRILAQQIAFIKQMPQLERLALELGDNNSLDSNQFNSITKHCQKLKSLKLHLGKNSKIESLALIKNIQQRLLNENGYSLKLSLEIDYYEIQFLNQKDELVVGLRIASDLNQQEYLFMKVIIQLFSDKVKNLFWEINRTPLIIDDNIIASNSFSNLKKLEIKIYSEQILTVAKLLEKVSHYSLETLQVSINVKGNQKMQIKYAFIHFEKQLTKITSLTSLKLKLETDFNMDFNLTSSKTKEMILNLVRNGENSKIVLNIPIIIQQQNQEDMNTFYNFLVSILASNEEEKFLLIKPQTIDNKRIVKLYSRSIYLTIITNQIQIDRLVKTLVSNLEGFKNMKQCLIEEMVNGSFQIIFIQQTQRFLSQHRPQQLLINPQEGFLPAFTIRNISNNEELCRIIRQLQHVIYLNIKHRSLNNNIINNISQLQKLEYLQLEFHHYKKMQENGLDEEPFVKNQKIKVAKVLSRNRPCRMKVMRLLGRIYKRLVQY